MSVLDPFRVKFKAAARALWGFKGELVLGGTGDVGEDKAVPGLDGASDEVDIVLGPIGTVRLLILCVEGLPESPFLGRGTRFSGT